MNVRHSVMLGTLGRYADRFHEYQPARSLEEKLDAAARIPGADGIEVVYPQECGPHGEHLNTVTAAGLPLSAVNVNVKGEAKFRLGSFTNPDASVRRQAVQYLKTGIELAAETGANMVSICPLIDGWDHAFEVDYRAQWAWLVEGFQEALEHRTGVRVSLEYKPFEVRNHIIIPNMGRALHFCSSVGRDDLGVTMDVGHALGANETPAAELCLAFDAGRLFYVHFNDNDRRWDWDTLPGAVNFFEALETLYYVRRLGWHGWFAYDVFTRHGDPAEAVEVTFRTMRRMDAFLERFGDARLAELVRDGTPAKVYDALFKDLLPEA